MPQNIMNNLEIKLRLPGGQPLTLNGTDIRVLLLRRNETVRDLARRLPCARENLSRMLTGKANYPHLRKKLARELQRMVNEMSQSNSGQSQAALREAQIWGQSP